MKRSLRALCLCSPGNGENPCANCVKAQKSCVRSRKGYRFSKNVRHKLNLGFSADQQWVETRNPGTLLYTLDAKLSICGIKFGLHKLGRLSYIDVTTQVQRGEKPTPPKHDDTTVAAQGGPQETNSEAVPSLNNSEQSSDVVEDNEDDEDNLQVEDTAMSPPPLPTSARPGPAISSVMSPPSFDMLARQTSHHSHSSLPLDRSHLIQTPTIGAPSFSPVSPSTLSDGALPMNRLVQHRWSGDSMSFTNTVLHTAGNIHITDAAVTPVTSIHQSPGSASALRGLPEGFSDEACLHLREACLLRHFTKNLAPWVSRTFTSRKTSLLVPDDRWHC